MNVNKIIYSYLNIIERHDRASVASPSLCFLLFVLSFYVFQIRTRLTAVGKAIASGSAGGHDGRYLHGVVAGL